MKPEAFFDIRWQLDSLIEKGGKRYVGGFVTSDRKDKQEETVLQNGLDFSHFVNKGYFNDNHSKSASGIVGIATKAELRNHPITGRKAWYAEGELIKTERADHIWEVANALKERKRSLGFSVEGKILKRNGKKIVKASVNNVAITPNPVNTDTAMEILSKGFTSIFGEDDDEYEKALAPGTSTDSEGATDGDALKTESLEGVKNTYSPGVREKEKEEEDDEEDSEKSMSLGNVFDRIIEHRPNLDFHKALNLAIRLLMKIQQGE